MCDGSGKFEKYIMKLALNYKVITLIALYVSAHFQSGPAFPPRQKIQIRLALISDHDVIIFILFVFCSLLIDFICCSYNSAELHLNIPLLGKSAFQVS